ncbi:MAG: L-seryl-tRNA(Sec) selenium transferase [Burkholderiales bacterium]|nr:L-seryl-tRNA(Sec) selenium transferase [Burkholderiales bacterium]
MANDLTLPGAGEASGDGNPATALARLPAIDKLLARPALADLVQQWGQALVKHAAQDELAAQRGLLKAGQPFPASTALDAAVIARVQALRTPNLKPVINLSGTVIHTNLGRSLLADEAIEAVAQAMRSYAALEYDLAGGERGDRDTIVEGLLCELTGAEAATVVNNNAAAVVLGLAALAARKQVLISRGELIEIGGSFRMPDIMTTAGCKLVEVGTTNRTHAKDFEAALGPKSGLIVKAHWSNYAITGFTASVDDATLAAIAHRHGVPYMVDLGAGALIDLSRLGLPREPMPQESLAAGADVVTFSGDKLLGGPQAGILVGAKAAIARIKKHPLKRALRLSKLTLAALEATLRIYVSAHRVPERLPSLRLLTRSAAEVRAACERLLPALASFAGAPFTARVAPCASQIGSGSLPVERLASSAIVLAPVNAKEAGRALDALSRRLRSLPVPVIGRVHDGALWLDLRCLIDEAQLARQLEQAPC